MSNIQVIQGDCLEVMKTMEDNSIDSIVTDPPYELGFMGKSRDSTGIANNVNMWRECLRVLKPGGHLLAFSGTRTYHRMASAIEDAGFEVRDMIEWVYGSGFPKSLNIGKAVDKLQGNEREVIETGETVPDIRANNYSNSEGKERLKANLTKGTSEWEGWGTALKPAHEPICMARKHIEGTVAENCLKYGTGGINIDESRVGANWKEERPESWFNSGKSKSGNPTYDGNLKSLTETTVGERLHESGRFPANLITDGSEEVRECFPESNGQGKHKKAEYGASQPINLGGGMLKPTEASSGNASRFFKSILYYPKASKGERNKGLDGQVLISIMGSYLFPITTKCTEELDQNQLHLLDIDAFQQKEGSECEIKVKKGKDLSISLYEKLITDQYLNECKYIIKTTTGGTMILAILNWLHHCITKEYTADVNGEIELGENLVEDVEGGKKLTTTIKGKIEFLLDVKPVVSEMQLIIKEKGNRNFHSTVKPIALMEYLIKMVTRAGGTVLDPFMGSGTTGVACKLNGYGFVGIEMQEEYVAIAQARIDGAEREEDQIQERQPTLFPQA